MCVRHQETAPLGIIEEVLRQEGVAWRYHDCWREPEPPSLAGTSGLIVLGGAMNADEIDTYPYLIGVRETVAEAVDAGLPVLGICLGAQILARALGGDVYRAERREIGFIEVRSTGAADDLLGAFAPQSRVFQFHEDTCSLPPGSELLFTGEPVRVQAFRVGATAYGVQFHFEVTMREIEAWCDEVEDLSGIWGMSKQEVLQQAEAELEGQQQVGRDVARRFAHLCAGRTA